MTRESRRGDGGVVNFLEYLLSKSVSSSLPESYIVAWVRFGALRSEVIAIPISPVHIL